MKPEVIVIGQNPSIILGQVRALGSAGYKVHVLKTVDSIPRRKTYELHSKYITSCDYISRSDDSGFASFLIEKFGNEGCRNVLIPGDDNVTLFIDRHCQELIPYFVFPNVKYESGKISFLMKKNIQKEIARICGLNVPKGWYIKWDNEKYIIPESIEYPCFVKPDVYHYNRKDLMKKCSCREELDTLLKSSPKGVPMLVEQFIDINQEYGVSGLSVNGKVMISSFIKKVDVKLGTTASGILYPMSENIDLGEKLTSFIEKLDGFTGIFDIDLYESHGKMYFCECNLRLGNSGVATLLNGINLPSMLVDALCEKIVDLHAPDFEPKFFVDERVFMQKYWNKEITWGYFRESTDKADLSYIKSNEDKKPYYFFMFGVIKRKIICLIRNQK